MIPPGQIGKETVKFVTTPYANSMNPNYDDVTYAAG